MRGGAALVLMLPMTAQVAEAVLPRVSGRHRDRALASARKCRAIQLKLQGLTYQQIADELGYTSRGTVYKIIKTRRRRPHSSPTPSRSTWTSR